MRITPRNAEGGFTLVELLIYSLLTVLVLFIAGGILMNGFTGERVVRGLTEAANSAQVTVESIERGVRNAEGLRISTPSGTDQMLVVRTAVPTGSYSVECVAWYYSVADRTIRTTTAATTISAAPTTTERASWTLLADGVGPVASEPVFSQNGNTVEFQFQVDAGDNAPIKIHSSSNSRAEALEASPCS